MTSINYFWIGERLSPMEILALNSCWQNGHLPVVWSFNKILNLPDFAVLKDASEVMPSEKFIYYKEKLGLPLPVVSDIFRYRMLRQVGGIYSDTDVIIIRNLDGLHQKPDFFCSTFEYGYGVCANNCFMKVTAGSVLAQYLCDESDKRLADIEKNGLAEENYCYLGPFLVQQCARDLPVTILPFDFINPISWRWVPKLIAFKHPDRKFLLKTRIRKYLPFIEGRGYNLTQNTYAVHLCNEIWKRDKLKKEEKYHSYSLFEKLKKKIKVSA